MIVDAHTHITVKYLRFGWKELEQWLSDKENKCVIMPIIQPSDDSVAINAKFFNTIKDFSRKKQVFPFLWIHPHQLVEQHFRKFSFTGFKFHPSISQSLITENRRVLDMCVKYNKPILTHCGRNAKSRMDYVLEVNEEYYDMPFICAHMGGMATDLIIRALNVLEWTRHKDNIFLDTAGCYHPELIKKAVRVLGSDKVIFGTDRPFHSYKVSRFAIDCCNFNKEVKRKILFSNALKLFGEG